MLGLFSNFEDKIKKKGVWFPRFWRISRCIGKFNKQPNETNTTWETEKLVSLIRTCSIENFFLAAKDRGNINFSGRQLSS